MRTITVVIGIVVCLWMGNAYAQESVRYEDILESFETEEFIQTDFLQILQDLRENPIDINSATIRDLLKIPFLNQQMAKSIVGYRNQNGGYKTETDLLNVPEMSEELLAAISPLIQFQRPAYSPLIDYRLQVGRSLHTLRGYEETDTGNHYQNPLYLYQRFRWNPSPVFSAGFLWEKDAGEGNWFDFGSFYLGYHWIKARSRFLVGDFNLEIGQRLLFGNPYGFPLSVATTYPFTQTPFRWHPKRAVDENAFLRGLLWDFSLADRTILTVAYSKHALGATFTPDSTAVQSIYSTGYHRTASEMDKKHRFNESILTGGIFNDFGKEQAGIQVSQTQYSLPVKVGTQGFRRNFNYLSGYYSSNRGLLQFQGEAAFLDGKFPAFQQTILLKTVQPRIYYGALVYYHHPDYWAFHGRAFGKSSEQPANETGYFLSISARVFPGTEISAYFHAARPVRSIDEFVFLNRSQQLQLLQRISKSQVVVRFTQRIRRGTTAESTQKYAVLEQASRVLRFHIDSEISKSFRLSHRIEFSRVEPHEAVDKNIGISFYQDIRFRPWKNLQLQLRWTQFDIPDYDYRLYEFENDLPGNFRNVLLNDRGFKWFLLFNYRIAGRWNFAFKYREIHYPDELSLGSGLDTVTGNRRRELRAQFQVIY